MNILIIGGSGFLGTQLHESLIAQSHNVTIKTRSKTKEVQKRFSKQAHPNTNLIENYSELDLKAHGSPDIVISLAGAGIIDKRWNAKRKQELIDSRINPLKELTSWLDDNKIKVDKLLVGSAIGFYGYRPEPDLELTETSGGYKDFCNEVCSALENYAASLNKHFTHISILRTGVVLGKNGGAFSKMLTPAKFHLNGKMGHGKQWVSWIHMQDWINAVEFIMQSDAPRNVYNLTSPNPTINKELSEAIAKALNKTLQLPVPSLSLKLLLGEASTLLLDSQKVLPNHITAAGFKFKYPHIKEACLDLIK